MMKRRGTAWSAVKRALRTTVNRAGYELVQGEDIQSLGPHLRTLFSKLRINCVLDVGANVGQYGRFLRSLGYVGEIVSFEPVAATFERLREAAAGDPAWQVHQMALGAAPAELDLHVAASSDLSSFLPSSDYGRERFGGLLETVRVERVAVKRLDDVLGPFVAHVADPRVYVKLDTQGYDVQVLEGATAVLPRILAVQVELAAKPIYEQATWLPDGLRWLSGLGFEITQMFPVNHDADGLRTIEFDCVAVRPPSP
jgi:FkbM family methyltransferase